MPLALAYLALEARLDLKKRARLPDIPDRSLVP
jgi:hypothetical protein